MLGQKQLGVIAKKTKDKLQSAMSSTVSVKLVHGRNMHDATVPAFTTFGQLKETAGSLTGVPLQHIKLNFKGRDKPDQDTLSSAGVKNGSKIFVEESDGYRAALAKQREAEDLAALQAEQDQLAQQSQASFAPASSHAVASGPAPPPGARAPPPTPIGPQLGSATEQAIAQIGSVARHVDELEGMVNSLAGSRDSAAGAGRLMELLTQKLLVLDGVEVTAESRQARKDQINRINALCDQLENMKTSEAQPNAMRPDK